MPEYLVKKVSDVDLAFGGNMSDLLPPYSDIPEEFQNMNNRTKWNKLISDWFYVGLNSLDLKPKESIDVNGAIRHIKAILASWEPKHEHKMAGCAYLMSLWFDDVKYEKNGG
jgi:hypothetical protein